MKPFLAALKSRKTIGVLSCVVTLFVICNYVLARRTPVAAPYTPRIVFTSGGSWGDIYIMDTKGRGQTRLTKNPNKNPGRSADNIHSSQPVLSPDRRHIAFVSRHQQNSDICVMNVDGTGQMNLTDTEDEAERSPRWSSDGSKIVFMSSPAGAHDIPAKEIVMNADGSGRTTDGAEERLIMSTHGKRITTTSVADFRAGKPREHYITNSDDSPRMRLPINVNDLKQAYIRDVRLSPNADKVVIVAQSYDNAEIYIMSADGTREKRLTNKAFRDDSPVFTSDGKQIVFVSNRDGNPEIYIMNTDGTGQTRLTSNRQEDGEPDVK